MSISFEQIQTAALEAISGKVPKPLGVEFNTYANLKIGVRGGLALKGILEPQQPFGYLADLALTKDQERIYKKVFEQLVADEILVTERDSEVFTVALIRQPFESKWQYVERIGRSGQAVAIKVRRKTDGILGVLKIPHTRTPAANRRFQREVAILEEINHPAIVRLLDKNLDQSTGDLGYVTPLGIPLDRYWLEEAPSLEPSARYDFAFRILQRICAGLEILHGRGVIHRDIKPENVVMIDDDPVLIDFGVALRSNEERLSVIDGRVVANRFGTPASAHYGLHDESPSWDSLGLAWLYGFLIGEGRRPKHFHWRFHPLVAESRRERARAILAACSHEQTVPSDAGEFIALMERFRLGKNTPTALQMETASLEAAVAAYADNEAAAMLRTAEQRELAEVCIQIIEGPLSEAREAMNRSCSENKGLPVILNAHLESEFVPPIMPKRPMREILQQIYKSSSEGYLAQSCIFSCTCGKPPKTFEILVNVGYSQNHVEDGMQFRLLMSCKKSGGEPPIWPDYLFTILKNATFQEFESGKIYSNLQLAELAYEWMTNPSFWHAIG